jgi:hypothetical protein
MKDDRPGKPWWKYGHVWLVISGPAVVVVAALVTAWIAASNPDPVLAQDYYRRPPVEVQKSAAADRALMPALQGRNHAATPPAR